MFQEPILHQSYVLCSSRPSTSLVVRIRSPPKSDGIGSVVVAEIVLFQEGNTLFRKLKVVFVFSRREDRVFMRDSRKVGSFDGSGGDWLDIEKLSFRISS